MRQWPPPGGKRGARRMEECEVPGESRPTAEPEVVAKAKHRLDDRPHVEAADRFGLGRHFGDELNPTGPFRFEHAERKRHDRPRRLEGAASVFGGRLNRDAVDGPADPFYPGVEMDRHSALLEPRPHPIGQPSIALHRPVQILADLLRCAGHRPDETGADQLGIGREESFDVGKRQPSHTRTKIHFAAQKALDAFLGFAGAEEKLRGLAEKRIFRTKPPPFEHVATAVGVGDIESRLLQQSPKTAMAAVDEVSAELDRRLAVASVSGPDPSAHAVPPLDDRDLHARGLELSRRGESCRPSPENQNVNLCSAHLRWVAASPAEARSILCWASSSSFRRARTSAFAWSASI